MKFNRFCRCRTATLFVWILLLCFLVGCHPQVVEKVGVLPDRPTQFVAHNTEDEYPTPEGKSWDVQNVDKLLLFSSEMTISDQPSVHYYNDNAFLYRTVSQESGKTLYSLEQIEEDGTLYQLHSLIAPANSFCYYSPDGRTAAYETWIDNCLTLMLIDLTTNEERILWQSDEASLLKDLGISARLTLQWSPDGNTLLFFPICYHDESSVPAESSEITSEDSAAVSDSTASYQDAIVSDQDSATSDPDDTASDQDSASSDQDSASSDPDDTTSDSDSTEESIDPMILSAAEKMQIIYNSLPNFPIIYAYQLSQQNMQSFLIAAEDYPLYDTETMPMICSNQTGSLFFIYFNSPWDPALAHYVDLPGMLHYSTPLNNYLPSFTQLGSEPLFYENLLYLHVDGVGIMVLDPSQGSLIAQYPFNDPIHSFTVYDNALIVAQPSGIGGGVDVTAYLLNLETKQSVLLYHNSETYSPFINYMEMCPDGMHLLIEQLPSESHIQKQLVQLSFQ